MSLQVSLDLYCEDTVHIGANDPRLYSAIEHDLCILNGAGDLCFQGDRSRRYVTGQRHGWLTSQGGPRRGSKDEHERQKEDAQKAVRDEVTLGFHEE